MPRLDPRVVILRNATVEAVERLLDTGKYESEAQALRFIRLRCLKRRKNTGFTLTTFEKFYQSFRDWKRSPDYCPQKPTDEESF